MNNSFEREVVICLNTYFTRNRKKGFAYRLKQSTFNTQYVDIIVDSPDREFYLAVECKSLKGEKLYFTSNFHKDKDGVHQIDNISGFVNYTGRKGFLAVEFRGRKNEAYLMPWKTVLEFFDKQASIPIEEFRKWIPLTRVAGGYTLESLSIADSHND
ncbi:MAG: Holliday junction resolvase [Methanocorpusculum sp.]|nr:Holliday junction resolvase [Methanocorpusculum sp.]